MIDHVDARGRGTSRARLRAATALGATLALMAVAGTAKAQNECGAPMNGAVTCTPADNIPRGISYDSADDLTVSIEEGVETHGPVFVTTEADSSVINDGTLRNDQGFNPGVGVSGAGSATLSGTGSVETTGFHSDGVVVQADRSFVFGSEDSGGGATVTITGNVTTHGTSSRGIVATADSGPVSVTSTGTVSTAGERLEFDSPAYGIVATSDGTVSVNAASVRTVDSLATAISADGTDTTVVAGTVRTAGVGASGIEARGDRVSVRASNIATTGEGSAGIVASGGAVTIAAGTVRTSGAEAAGLSTRGPASIFPPFFPPIILPPFFDPLPDTATIVADDVAVTGAGSIGIDAAAIGAVSVTAGRVSAADSPAIAASSFDGAVAVTLNGAATTGSGPAITIDAATDATFRVGAAGTITSATGGVTLAAGGRSTVDNAGSILGDGAAPVIVATGGPLAVANGGRLAGLIGFTGGDDALVNTGTYEASANQDFGGGTDTLANSGRLLVRPGATTPGSVAFTGLERFANSGLASLANGQVGDTLSVSGDFAGSGGSTLAIDAAPGASDRLIVAGAITGATTVAVSRPGGGAATLDAGTVFASGGAGSSAGAFAISGASQNDGLIRYAVAFGPATGRFALVGTPGDAVFRALKINEGAQLLWHKSADAWSSHMADLRDRDAAATHADGRVWGQMYGGTDRRRDVRGYTAFGVARTVDTSFEQDAFGGQLGVDLGDGPIVFGVTGGFLDSNANFRGTADRARYRVANGGGYAGFAAGGFFADVLGKVDYVSARALSQSAGFTDRFHGFSYGVQGDVGFRLGTSAAYVQPVATLAYVRTDLNDLRAPGGTIDFDTLDGLRGKAGLRAGATIPTAGGPLTAYAQGAYVHEFEGRDGIAFESGGLRLAYRNRPLGDYGEAKLGFSLASPAGVTGFVEGFGDAGRAYRGGGARAGLRIGL